MSVSKDPTSKSGTWRVYVRYKDYMGNWQTKTKRGFKTKKEGQEWEREFMLNQSKDLDMKFASFVDCYISDIRPALKDSTMETKMHIIRTKLLPYFEKKSMSAITRTDILQWQNDLIKIKDKNGNGYSQTYLRTIQNQLTAIFNHAQIYYGLQKNPLQRMRKIGKEKPMDEMQFWTKEEYLKFIETMKNNPMSYYCFELLYYTGIRVGEALALTISDFDFERGEVKIRRTYSVIEERDYIRKPKTETSERAVALPKFLCEDMKDYLDSLYEYDVNDRIFPFTKSRLEHERNRGCLESGVKRIRIHDIRHSHVAYLISLGFSPLEIAKRVGHSNEKITELYSHLYPSQQQALINRMDEDYKKSNESEMDGGMENVSEE